MAFVDDPNSNNNTQQVAGSSPLASGPTTDSATQPSDSSSGGSGGAPMQSSGQQSKPPKNPNKPSSRASSGMYTNIQKYAEKNKPQAQKMATEQLQNIQNVAKQAEQKRQNVLSQFTQQAQSSGLHNTEENVQNLQQFTRQQAGLDPAQEQSDFNDQKFQDVINAQYKGPKSLVDTGSLYQAMNKQAQEAANTGQLSQTAEGRTQLLRNLYTQGGKDYSQGASGLDSLLLGQQTDTLGQIEQAGQQIGSREQIMQQASQGAADIANQTRSGVDATRQQARDAFSGIASERQKQVDARVNAVVDNWDTLPQHFREALSNPDGTVNLSKIEAATLGVQSGEGLYNLSGEDLFGTAEDPAVAAERARLISKDEQGNLARLQALSNLAQTGEEKLYDIGQYFDESKAGTQNAMDALNLEGVRSKLAQAERGFRNDATQNVTGFGRGSSKYNKGWGRGRGKMRAKAEKSANLRSLLENQGYDFGEDIQTQNTSNMDILRNLASIAQGDPELAAEDSLFTAGRIGENTDLWEEALGSDWADYGNVGGIEGQIHQFSNEMTRRFGEGIQNDMNSVEKDLFGSNNSVVGDLITGQQNLIGQGIEGLASAASNLGNTIFGGGKGKAEKKAKAKAESRAVADLRNKLSNQLQSSGFKNRLGVQDNEQTMERNKKLFDILRNLDLTNESQGSPQPQTVESDNATKLRKAKTKYKKRKAFQGRGVR